MAEGGPKVPSPPGLSHGEKIVIANPGRFCQGVAISRPVLPKARSAPLGSKTARVCDYKTFHMTKGTHDGSIYYFPRN